MCEYAVKKGMFTVTHKGGVCLNLSFGMITKDLLSTEPVLQFIQNARRHGHEIYSLIVGYSGVVSEDVLQELKEMIPVELVNTLQNNEMCSKLHGMGLSEEEVHALIRCEASATGSMIPYGKNRNNVIMQALMSQVDVLVFIDTDVYPYLMVDDALDVCRVDIDFIGRHLEYLEKQDVVITTSDYSGYYIIPPMMFDGMEDLFIGLQKESAYQYMQESYKHNCLVKDSFENRHPFETDKILGGNMAIKLSIFKKILPFFSSSYEFGGKEYLTRGEDTLMGAEMERIKDMHCIDIDTRIFHNTYGTYPKIPDICKDPVIRERFYRACMGWIGRNPFMNWLNGNDVHAIASHQRAHLVKGCPLAAEYLNDERFEKLPEALDAALAHLPTMIEEYHQLVKGWKAFTHHWEEWR